MPSPTPTQINILNTIFNPLLKGFAQSFLTLWWMYLIIFLLLSILLFIKLNEIRKFSRSGIRDIDRMTGEEFENRLVILFRNLDYKANRTVNNGTQPDYGGDLVIEKNGERTVVQAKRAHKFVGEDAVREALGAKNIYNCTKAMVVTNSHFSNMAWHLAKSNNVKLYNRNNLIKLLLTEKNLKVKHL